MLSETSSQRVSSSSSVGITTPVPRNGKVSPPSGLNAYPASASRTSASESRSDLPARSVRRSRLLSWKASRTPSRGQVDVGLQVAISHRHRGLEGGQGVLGSLAATPAMGEGDRGRSLEKRTLDHGLVGQGSRDGSLAHPGSRAGERAEERALQRARRRRTRLRRRGGAPRRLARSLTRALPPIAGMRCSASLVESRPMRLVSSDGSRSRPGVSAKMISRVAPMRDGDLGGQPVAVDVDGGPVLGSDRRTDHRRHPGGKQPAEKYRVDRCRCCPHGCRGAPWCGRSRECAGRAAACPEPGRRRDRTCRTR